jgi:hypothetical protein
MLKKVGSQEQSKLQEDSLMLMVMVLKITELSQENG